MGERQFSRLHYSLTAVLFLISILFCLNPDASASTRQSRTLKRAPLSSTLHDYAGVAQVKLSEMGEMVGFEYPAGYEHIYTGSLLEGYSISYTVGEVSYHYYTNYDNTSGGISPVSYTVLEDSATTLIVEAITKTDNNVLEIKNRFVMNKSESKISIIMTVRNISDAVVSDIRLKRVCDLDLDTDGDYGWADYDDWFGLASAGVKTWTENPPEGREAHSMDSYGIPQPTWFAVDNWNDWEQRENTDESFTYPVYGDYTSTLSWDLNNLNAGQSSIPYTAVYTMGIQASNKPTAQTTNAAGEAVSVYNDSGSVYVTGTMFPVSQAVNVYIVPDKGWANGDAVTGSFTTITTDASGQLPATVIWANPPTVGNYDVFVDVNGNGIFDYESDAVIGEGSVGFSVIRECVPTISVPHNFVPGTPAKAEEVNENFQLLYQTINGLICEVEYLKSRLDAMIR